MKQIGNILWGIVLITIGVIFGLNALEITSINVFFEGWWTLFIIVPCFIGLIKDNDKTGNLIGLLIGVVLLLCSRNIISFSLIWKLIVPTILVIIGLSFIEMIKLIHVNQIDIEDLLRFASLKKLSIYNSKIISFEKLENINKLQELNLDGSNIEDTVCTNLLNKGVNIHYSDEYLPF